MSRAGDVALRSFIGDKNVLIFFYPKDNTPGCIKEACAFEAASKKIIDTDTVIIGVSPDSVKSHMKFRDKFGLKFMLLADEDHRLAEACGVWTMKQMYGKSYMGIQRSTFLFNKKGIAIHVWPKVSVDGHDAEVLATLATIKS